MASTVVGLYDQHNVAEKVFRELKNSGIQSDALTMISHEQTDLSSWNTESRNWDRGQFGHDITDRLVNLGVPRQDAEMYTEGVRRGGTLVVAHVDDESTNRTAEIMNRYNPVDIHTRSENWRKRGFRGYDRRARPFSHEEVRQEREHIAREENIPLAEEEIRVGKREVDRGGVRVHTHVVSRPFEEQVRLRDETIDVERRNVDRPVTDADRAFQERTIEMHETDEEPVVSKEAHITGEVVVRKGEEEHTETIRDTLRKTEVDVENLAGSRERGGRFDDVSNEFRTHSETTYGSGTWNTYEPAYRWGYTTGSSDRYRGRSFSEVEPELRRDYEQQQGGGTWDRVKEAIRHAFNRARQ